MGFHFERLRMYQRAEACLSLIYLLAAALPPEERFNLAEQLRRAALGIVLNIAESTERRSARDAARFIEIALGSLVEVSSCLRIARQHYTLPHEPLTEARAEYEILYRQLHAYRNSLLKPTH